MKKEYFSYTQEIKGTNIHSTVLYRCSDGLALYTGSYEGKVMALPKNSLNYTAVVSEEAFEATLNSYGVHLACMNGMDHRVLALAPQMVVCVPLYYVREIYTMETGSKGKTRHSYAVVLRNFDGRVWFTKPYDRQLRLAKSLGVSDIYIEQKSADSDILAETLRKGKKVPIEAVTLPFEPLRNPPDFIRACKILIENDEKVDALMAEGKFIEVMLEIWK
jgi:hypothetical protein